MKKYLIALIPVLLVVAACKKNELIFTESNKALTGSWRIVKAIRNGEDITAWYDFSKFRINFADSSYTLTEPVPFVVSGNGKWSFNDPQYPNELSFRPDGSTTPVKPVFRYPVVKGRRSLILNFSPGCATSKYEYTLEPLPQ